jgi:RNA polymerase-binding transcription factor DksA
MDTEGGSEGDDNDEEADETATENSVERSIARMKGKYEESDIESEEDSLVKFEKWRITKGKVQLLCTWEINHKEEKIWEPFELLQIDYPDLIAEYLNNNIDCFVKCKTNEVILDEIQKQIKITDKYLERIKATIETKRNAKVVEVTLQDCESEHNDLWSFNDIDKKEWYKVGTKLFGTLCKDCGKNISEETLTVSKPVKLCKNYGTKGCCVTLCNTCRMDILNNSSNTNKRRGR